MITDSKKNKYTINFFNLKEFSYKERCSLADDLYTITKFKELAATKFRTLAIISYDEEVLKKLKTADYCEWDNFVLEMKTLSRLHPKLKISVEVENESGRYCTMWDFYNGKSDHRIGVIKVEYSKCELFEL